MKGLILTLILFSSILFTSGQNVRINGMLANCTDSILKIIPITGYFTDSIIVNSNGVFNYETDKTADNYTLRLRDSEKLIAILDREIEKR